MLSKSLRQVRPRPNHSISHVQKVQSLLEQDEAKVDIQNLLPKSDSDRTQIFEAAVCFVAIGGVDLNTSKLKSVMKNNEFSRIAKDWTEALLKDEKNGPILSEYYSDIGFPIAKLDTFTDFIHENIKEYYKATPSSFEYEGGQKDNTADLVLIVDSNKNELIRIFNEIKKLPVKEQVLRAKTDSTGKITISDSAGKELSFYQVSAKVGADLGRIGKVGAFINRNIIGATPNLPSTLLDLINQDKKEDYGHLSDREIELFTEGFFSNIIDKFKTVATQGIKVFVNWVKGVFGKIYQSIAKKSETDINKEYNTKSVQAANSLLQKSRMSSLVEQAVKNDGAIKKQVVLVKDLVKNINKLHKDNIKLCDKLNSRPKMKVRPRPPILFDNPQAGLVDENTIIKELSKLENMKNIPRDKFKLFVSITSNFAANVAVNKILKNFEKEVVKYEDLTESIFAFSSTLDAEARFGNTSLPLVISYGGKKTGYNKVVGKRDEYTKKNTTELLEKGKQLNNFYVVVVEIYRTRGKDYNQASVHFVTGFKEEDKKPTPIYQKMTIANSSGSKFATKLEFDGFSPKSKIGMWAA